MLRFLCISALLAACADTSLDTEVSALETENGMTFNGMTFNGMTFNGMTFNGMTFNGISSKDLDVHLDGRSVIETLLTEALDENQSPVVAALTQFPDGEQLLRYSVKCGFEEGQEFASQNWSEPAPGVLGLFGQWESQGLSGDEIELWYGCMLAHVNALGKSVPISILGRQPTIESPDKGYDVREAAFYGGFADAGAEGTVEEMNACFSDEVLDACGTTAAAVAFMNDRYCGQLTNPYPGGCPMTIVGVCSSVCSDDDGISLADCQGSGTHVYSQTAITVNLRNPINCDP